MLELIDRIAALVPPPRTHRHRYFGVLAPNSPLRAAVTAMAVQVQNTTAQVEPPHISRARGPPLWDDCDAPAGAGSQIGPDWDLAAQKTPDYEGDQRVNW